MESAIWISYDFGVREDYEGIYTWLDEHGAIECGDTATKKMKGRFIFGTRKSPPWTGYASGKEVLEDVES